jgi:hypothetical protein
MAYYGTSVMVYCATPSTMLGCYNVYYKYYYCATTLLASSSKLASSY